MTVVTNSLEILALTIMATSNSKRKVTDFLPGVRWACLEGDGSAPLPGGGVALPTAIKGPYASGRDWAAIEKNLAKEAEEKKEGEAALNEMFQKIYGDASDDVKKAMNKSFQVMT